MEGWLGIGEVYQQGMCRVRRNGENDEKSEEEQ
jgi:hypothetical protein